MLKIKEKKRFIGLGICIGTLFLTAFSILIFATYVILSQNFKKMLTDYTLTFVQSMVEQGVTAVEYELHTSQEEVVSLANAFSIANVESQTVVFPEVSSDSDILRMVYVTEDDMIASDSQNHYLRERQDIKEAFCGETVFYGPYFNKEKEYVVCYSTPVYQDGKMNGVLSIEKDGYSFCSLIKKMEFANIGTTYIINKEGINIAFNEQDDTNWIGKEHYAWKELKKKNDFAASPITKQECGTDIYYWKEGPCYLVYAPIPSTHWMILSSLYEEELLLATKKAIYYSITESPLLHVCIIGFLLSLAMIIIWIISSFKKTVEINEKLNLIANYDSLTGTMNRNSYYTAIEILSKEKYHSFACIYIDVNGLHEINNHLGHQAGDTMLRTVVEVLQNAFSQKDVYRIGGDEFVVFCQDQDEENICYKMKLAQKDLKKYGYEISIGIEWRDKDINIKAMVNMAEKAMNLDKQRYYQENGKERQMRILDQELERMVLEKQDADAFLSVLAPEFKGVYFVDLGSDTIRHLYIPPYFEEMLIEAGDVFSRALYLYAQRIVEYEYRQQLMNFCNYSYVEKQLKKNTMPEFIYQKTDGTWLQLRILKFKTYTEQCKETLWIFSSINNETK